MATETRSNSQFPVTFTCGVCLGSGPAEEHSAITGRTMRFYVRTSMVGDDLTRITAESLEKAGAYRCHDCAQKDLDRGHQLEKVSTLLAKIRGAIRAEKLVLVEDYASDLALLDKGHRFGGAEGDIAPVRPVERKLPNGKLACGLPGAVPCCDKTQAAPAFRVEGHGKGSVVVGICETARDALRKHGLPTSGDFARAQALVDARLLNIEVRAAENQKKRDEERRPRFQAPPPDFYQPSRRPGGPSPLGERSPAAKARKQAKDAARNARQAERHETDRQRGQAAGCGKKQK